MNWFKKFASRIFGFFGVRQKPYCTVKVKDVLPDKLNKQTIYIVEDDGYQEQAAMLCPCGCQLILHMNLLPDERPCWTVREHNDGTVSLQPSVWRKTDCRSHFWFIKGKVQWVESSELLSSKFTQLNMRGAKE
jgi:hypothetical protein